MSVCVVCAVSSLVISQRPLLKLKKRSLFACTRTEDLHSLGTHTRALFSSHSCFFVRRLMLLSLLLLFVLCVLALLDRSGLLDLTHAKTMAKHSAVHVLNSWPLQFGVSLKREGAL